MKIFYCLTMTDTELQEDFSIGIFPDQEEAEKIASYYLANVPGFCEYPCTVRITEKYLAGLPECPESATDLKTENFWIVQGWDLNQNHDAISLIESELFLTKEQAERELHNMQEKFSRSEWAIDCLTLGESHWADGFVRISN